MNKNAFSIMELSIAIIILAAIIITVPYIKINYKKQELYEKFRKTYSNMNLALNMSVIENGSIDKWDFFNGDVNKILNSYFAPYFTKHAKQNCNNFSKAVVKSLDGFDSFEACEIYGVSSKIQKGILRIEGATFGIFDVDSINKEISIVIDTNGYYPPNIIGRDIFKFKINDSIYAPYTESGVSNQNCSTDLIPKTGIVQGLGCADRLMNDGMMDY